MCIHTPASCALSDGAATSTGNMLRAFCPGVGNVCSTQTDRQRDRAAIKFKVEMLVICKNVLINHFDAHRHLRRPDAEQARDILSQDDDCRSITILGIGTPLLEATLHHCTHGVHGLFMS